MLKTVLLCLCLSLGFCFAEDDPATLNKQIYQHFANKDYAAAVTACRELVKLQPESNEAQYNLACALARTDDKDGALSSLAKSVELGFSDADHMGEDDDLVSLHTDARFDEAVKKAREKEKSGEFEKGEELEGVKTVENLPDGGLRYRLRMSPTAEEKPNRLIVWLHPSGGSMNQVVEKMAPLLIKHGFALLVITRKQWMGWTGPEAEKLINKTLPDVAKIKASMPPNRF
jgi:tetratricopeptide (TPR) repeat protein